VDVSTAVYCLYQLLDRCDVIKVKDQQFLEMIDGKFELGVGLQG
jgi:hypothetical protein